MHNYYTNCSPLILPSYGKHIQNLVDYMLTIKDKTTRTQYVHTLVSLIQKIHTTGKNKFISLPKIWNDFWIMSKYQLNVDSPFPKPKKIVSKDAYPIAYNTHKPSKHAQHYGFNITNYISKIADLSDMATQEQLLTRIVRLISKFYRKCNNLDIVFEHIKEIAGEKLVVHFDSIKKKIKI